VFSIRLLPGLEASMSMTSRNTENTQVNFMTNSAALITEYFLDPAIKALYKLSPEIDFNAQGGKVYKKLFTDFMVPYGHLVEYCLQYIPVLIYNGQNDIIVENPGTMRWVEQLHHAKAQDFRSTLFSTWKVNGKVAGSVKKAGNLEFRIVNNAGHLVPMDQGENALEMVKSFVEPNRNSTKL
jgi:carboxypeptidase C (cathepsin A)